MYRTILVPLDGSPLSEVALEHLHQVASPESAVLLLRVLEMTAEPVPAVSAAMLSALRPIAPAAVSDRVPGAAGGGESKAFLDAEEYLHAKAASLRGRVATARALVLGDTDPAATITSVAENEQADLIVMASHGRSGVVRWALGSVAEAVVRSTHRPILLIRPGRPVE
jgi:nucleotide-binding universal stress UspA family protein